jgi:hypothetical protein
VVSTTSAGEPDEGKETGAPLSIAEASIGSAPCVFWGAATSPVGGGFEESAPLQPAQTRTTANFKRNCTIAVPGSIFSSAASKTGGITTRLSR